MEPMKPCTRRTFLAGAATLAAPSVVRAQSSQEIVIGLPSTSLGSAMPRLSHEMGLFARNGLRTRLTVLESASVSTAALISGAVQQTQAGPGEQIAAQARGQKVVCIGVAYSGFSQSLVLSKVAAKKTGVAPEATLAVKLKALQGLTIATTSATASPTFALRRAAANFGVDVRFTYMTQPTFAAALERGAIDGFIGSAPFSTMSIAKGLGVMWANGPGLEFPDAAAPANSGLLLVMRDYAQANPEVISKFVASYTQFAEMVMKQPDDVKAFVARLFPDLDAATLDLFYASESSSWAFRPVTVAEMAHELRFIKESGVPIPNLDAINPKELIWP
jgi:ABC-type nitrate/sulfonate/bicarbonate transport system substrate-binding protein